MLWLGKLQQWSMNHQCATYQLLTFNGQILITRKNLCSLKAFHTKVCLLLIPGVSSIGLTEQDGGSIQSYSKNEAHSRWAKYLPCPSSSSSVLRPWSPQSFPSAVSSWRPVEASSHSCLPPLPLWGPQQEHESGLCPFSSGPCGWELLLEIDLICTNIWIHQKNKKLKLQVVKSSRRQWQLLFQPWVPSTHQ